MNELSIDIQQVKKIIKLLAEEKNIKVIEPA